MAYAGSAQFSVFTIDGFDLIPAKLQEATWKTGVRQEQTTGLGDRWEDHTPTGLRFVDITQSGAYFDTRQNGIHEAFKDTPLAYRTLVLAPAGDLPGSPLVVAAGTLSTTYDVQASNGKLTKANVTYVISGAVTEGAIVQPPAAHTANWTSATVDNGKATTTGGTAVERVSALTAAGFVGTLRHSPDGVAFVDLVAFPNVTTAGPPATVAISGTIERYVQFVGTLTGAGSVTVVCSLTRNP